MTNEDKCRAFVEEAAALAGAAVTTNGVWESKGTAEVLAFRLQVLDSVEDVPGYQVLRWVLGMSREDVASADFLQTLRSRWIGGVGAAWRSACAGVIAHNQQLLEVACEVADAK